MRSPGLAIGLTISIDVLFGGPFTGAAMNPSRAFGPQLVGDHWANGWVWYAGPCSVRCWPRGLRAALPAPPKLESVGSAESGVLEPRAGESA